MSSRVKDQIVDNRYRILERIGQGGMGIVYRAIDRLNGQAVALKRVMVAADDLTFGSQSASHMTDPRLALAVEFRTMAGLRHPHIVDVLDYGFEAFGQPYFTMQLIPNAQTLTGYAADVDLPNKVRLLVETLQALAYLHRRDVVHRDLKPANVLVTSEGVVKVMDFGLALHRKQTIPNLGKGLVGTLAYIAPELIREEQATAQSDLYAVGIIAYEFFVGRHPFYEHKQNARTLIDSILMVNVDVSMLDTALGKVVNRLLAKNPADRYPNANAVIKDLCEATGQPLPEESAAMRESFLQAAPFVGRENELRNLTSALNEAMQGRGSAWLIAGESGVGKSRLLDELRVRALVQGALVLRGQAIEGGSVPYRVWRSVVRRLVVMTETSHLEAGILKELVPDMTALLDVAVPDALQLTGEASAQRLHIAVVDLFKRQERPMVLLLEDLHWSTESLEVLRMVVQLVTNKPLLIVGTYRSDETPYLYGKLPLMEFIHLSSLKRDEVEQLSVGMLGEAGRRADLVDLLLHQTEGNIFFMIEVVRELAERAGRLDEIGHIPLPEQVFARGVLDIGKRRLKRLPLDFQPMLRFAAVLGRELDFNLLQYVDDAMDYDDWLLACADAAILEVSDRQWRFTHDAMRQAILEDLDPAEVPRLNRIAAQAIETIYSNNLDYAMRLVEHWHLAGNSIKEVHYAKLSGERKLHMSSFESARRYFERALTIAEANQQPISLRLELETKLATACFYLGDLTTAKGMLETVLMEAQTQGDIEAQVRSRFQLSLIETAKGNLKRAEGHLQEALPLAQFSGSKTLMVRVIWGLGDLAWRSGSYHQANHYLKDSLALAREIGQVIWVLDSLNSLGMVARRQGQHEEAKHLYTEGYLKALETGNLERAGTAMHNLALISSAQDDDARAQKQFEIALEIFKKIGKQEAMATALIAMSVPNLRLNRPDESRRNLREAFIILQHLDSTPLLHIGMGHFARLLIAEGHIEHGLAYFGLILQQPVAQTHADVRYEIEALMAQLSLSPQQIESGLAGGQSLLWEHELEIVFAALTE